MNAERAHRLRRMAGLLAIGVLGALLLLLPRWGGLRLKALVDADQTFRLSTATGGQHSWSLRAGWPAEGEALVREQVLRFERSDLVELAIDPELRPGQAVQEGQIVAWLRSPADARAQAENEALRAQLEAQRALLQAGGRPEEIAEATRRVGLARAAWEGHQPELTRVRALHAQGAASAAELEATELQDHLLALEIQVAEAAREVVGSPARPEALAAVDAELAALDARAAELASRLEGSVVRSPITGLLEMGGRNVVLRVYDLDPVYLRMALPERERHQIRVGSTVRFSTPAVSQVEFTGAVVDIGEDAVASELGGQIFWVSAEIANPELLLRSGMSGVARIDLHDPRGLLDATWREWMGFGP